MRRGTILVMALIAVPTGVALANSDGLKVTGGGQVVAGSQETGPGDTIAFNAQQTSDKAFENGAFPAKGQIQVIDRTNKDKFHGDVTCIRTFTSQNNKGSFVRFGGYEQVKGQPNQKNAFRVDAQDNGEGALAPKDDMIYFRELGENADPCDMDDEESTELRSTTLARGNVQQH